jgi:hypothetical protein
VPNKGRLDKGNAVNSEHLILAGIFALLFIAPLVWLFVFDNREAPSDAAIARPAADDSPIGVPPLERG